MIIGKCPVCGADMRVGSDMSNADRIRNMEDEELAKTLSEASGNSSKSSLTYGISMYCAQGSLETGSMSIWRLRSGEICR